MPGGRALTSEAGPESWSKVSIVGLGVIGGSMARALRERLPRLELVGIDRAEVVASGTPRSLVGECVVDVDEAAVQRAFASSDLVVLAAPISGIQRWLEPALAHGALVTDCGSTKRELVEAARALPRGACFVPGHPMAGAGASRAAARADLFEGRPWVLCPDGVEPAALAAVERLVTLVGARPVRMTAAEHDRAVALTSHAPRLVSSALTVLVERAGAFDAAGPAFERLMRGAGGAPEMWRDVLESNADEVARALRALLAELQACADELERADLQRSLGTLAAAERARQAREATPSSA
ncbi:MAG TPA: prephenate dehydrogenase/arogenate dehydrogenase family protein [Polyangiaceae bacterium]|nr:prephenate dehydrogenase/arogenate dehydrogenase family protein [Polyangiaceae bacterium]